MSQFTEEDRSELGIFLRGPHGQHMLDYLRANQPSPPVEVGAKMEVHHVQVNYGFSLGLEARIKQIINLAEKKARAEEPEPAALFDGKTLR